MNEQSWHGLFHILRSKILLEFSKTDKSVKPGAVARGSRDSYNPGSTAKASARSSVERKKRVVLIWGCSFFSFTSSPVGLLTALAVGSHTILLALAVGTGAPTVVSLHSRGSFRTSCFLNGSVYDPGRATAKTPFSCSHGRAAPFSKVSAGAVYDRRNRLGLVDSYDQSLSDADIHANASSGKRSQSSTVFLKNPELARGRSADIKR